jgi:hypothetical protein
VYEYRDETFSADVSLGDEGEIIFSGLPSYGPCDGTFTVPAVIFTALNLFNEERPNFDWYGDGNAAAQICETALSLAGYDVVDGQEFERVVRQLCTPGGIPTGRKAVKIAPQAP